MYRDGIPGVDGAGPARRRSERIRLFVVLAGLYVAQATPVYLVGTAALPIMREQGVSRTAIGMVGLLLLPTLLKFLWAPQIDRIRPFARAHRAGWIGLTQVGIIATLVGLSFVEPSKFGLFMAVGMVLSLLISTQDIAIDGYATKHLAPADRPIGNAIQGGGAAAGVILGGTASLVVYQIFGWQAAVLLVAAISLLPLAVVFLMHEEHSSGGSGSEKRATLRAFFSRPEARRLLVVVLVYRSSEGLMTAMEKPYLVDNGVALDTIGYLTGGAAAVAGLAGSAAAAHLMMKAGSSTALGLFGLMRSLCYGWFALHALGLVGGYYVLFGAAAGHALVRYMEIVVLYSLFMEMSSRDQPGTDFSIFACSQVLVFLAGMAIAGLLADAIGYGPLFAFAAAISAAATAFTVYRLAGREEPALAQ